MRIEDFGMEMHNGSPEGEKKEATAPVAKPRAGWAEAARAVAEAGEDALLDPETPTEFDENEWEW